MCTIRQRFIYHFQTKYFNQNSKNLSLLASVGRNFSSLQRWRDIGSERFLQSRQKENVQIRSYRANSILFHTLPIQLLCTDENSSGAVTERERNTVESICSAGYLYITMLASTESVSHLCLRRWLWGFIRNGPSLHWWTAQARTFTTCFH